MARTVKDTRDTVGLGQQSGVGHGEPDADAETLYTADDWTGLSEYHERLQVADDEPGEQHEAQLAPGSLDDRRVEVL